MWDFEHLPVKNSFIFLFLCFQFDLHLYFEIDTMLKILKRIFLNRYFIALLAFTVWMVFFDTNSIKRQRTLNQRIREIKSMKDFYTAEIAKNNKAIEELDNDLEAIEKYGREKYLMKRDSEDVYIITRE
jgi:cell division protein FtsB